MTTSNPSEETRKEIIKEAYGAAAEGSHPSCCGSAVGKELALGAGYSTENVERMPADALLGLGSGNPVSDADLTEGEVVLDLGSGGGIDAVLASQQVGHGGKVIGVDMTPEMIERARSLAEEMGLRGVEFRLGEIEDIPVDDNSVDVVISNCVINLSLDKPKVFREVHRVLRPGGRMVISDVVLTRELPESIRTNPGAIAGCIAGAVTLGKYLDTIIAEGIVLERVTARPWSPCPEPDSPDPLARKILDSIPEVESLQGVALSVAVIARKPE